MISRENVVSIMKAVAKGTWNSLPTILTLIPATAVAGKVLCEVKKIADDAVAAKKSSEETKAAVDEFIRKNGGEDAVASEIKQELKEARDPKNPKYINCAIYTVKSGDCLSEEEMDKLSALLSGETEAEDNNTKLFLQAFIEDYFAGDIASCDYPLELDPNYIAFNFDDSADHEYLDEDLALICEELNRIVGRNAFDDYEGYGTDDSVNA